MIIAIVGAESTGKTTLAQALTAALRADGEDAVVVTEHLREWCDHHGRTPRRDEQPAIAFEQTLRIAAAAESHAVVVADTTALMTAVYSDWVFGDTGLYPHVIADHRRCTYTLLTALDLPWRPDDFQRDGAFARAPVDALLRTALGGAAIEHAVITGSGAARCAQALAAVRTLKSARGI